MCRLAEEPLGVTAAQTRIAFNLIGGSHQFLHIVPVAVALSQSPDVEVTAYVSDTADAATLADMVTALGGEPLPTQIMSLPYWLSWPGRIKPRWKALKIPRLL